MRRLQHLDRVSDLGTEVARVPVKLSHRFLELFSAQLYSSPNKAFEELISNSWDAGASTVYVWVPEDLDSPNAAVWVLDNGVSMDVDGFRALWTVAESPKAAGSWGGTRPPIGKFGIGKLATYQLAERLTYVCRAVDGAVRAIAMDYTSFGAACDQLDPQSVELPVHQLTLDDVATLLQTIDGGADVLELIHAGVPRHPESDLWETEFGGEDPPAPVTAGTWTLALLTSLKAPGRRMQRGRIRHLLRTALPLGSSIQVNYNGEPLSSSKIDVPVEREWEIGPGLEIPEITLPGDELRKVAASTAPYPYVEVEGIPGRITGCIRLYEDRISGGKSADQGASNGFLINILGRVVNPHDPYFGLDNLSHTAWAQFRAAVRADGLNEYLAVNRQGLRECSELITFRAFLMALFNKARNAQAKSADDDWEKVRTTFTRSWGLLPLEPLRRVVAEGLDQPASLPGFLDAADVSDAAAALAEWERTADTDPARLVDEVEIVPGHADLALVRYHIGRRRVVINASHPFSREHTVTTEQRELLRSSALVEILAEAYMSDMGIPEGMLQDVRDYRDRALRLVAQIKRRSAAHVADVLLRVTDHAKGLEVVVGDALECLGFGVERLGQPGEPEGVATSPVPPRDDGCMGSYRFTYDAKSTSKPRAKTGNLCLDGLASHRRAHQADHTLVVAPDFQDGTLPERCEHESVTPMRARDLAQLLIVSFQAGPVNLERFREVFGLYDPDRVGAWVDRYAREARRAQGLSLDALFRALTTIGYEGPNPISVSVICRTIGQLPGSQEPKRLEVRALLYGLLALMPNLVVVSNDDVWFATSPQKLREEFRRQLDLFPPQYRADGTPQDAGRDAGA